jgi:hypothetical protein
VAERFWQKTYSYQKAEVRVSYSSRSYFLILYMRESLTNDLVKCLRCGEMGAAGVWHAKQPYREHHYTSYSWLSDDSNDDIHFIISITKQLLLKLSRVIGHF